MFKTNKMLTRIIRRHSARISALNTQRTITNDGFDDEKLMAKRLLENAATFADTKPNSQDDKWATLPYVQGTVFPKHKRDMLENRQKMDPENTSVILFEGHGKQHVGMIKKLMECPDARDLFESANEILQYDLLKLCLEGPQEQLDQTVYGQPAVFVTSLAALARLKEQRPNAIHNCIATAGFSLGEITALVFAGALPFDKALQLVQIRAEAMRIASKEASGAMVAVKLRPSSNLQFALEKAKKWCAAEKGIENPECAVAHYLFPSLKVIAGHTEVLDYIKEHKDKLNLVSVKKVAKVFEASHTRLMASVVEPFTEALASIDIKDPIIHVYSNVDGQRYRNAAHIRKQLPEQIIHAVKWEQLLHNIYKRRGDGFPRTFTCGPSSDLLWMLKMVNAKAWDSAIQDRL